MPSILSSFVKKIHSLGFHFYTRIPKIFEKC
jgi:hypothetical protein